MVIQSANFSFGAENAAPEALTLGFRILAVADFSRKDRGIGTEAEAQAYAVDKDSFADLFAKMEPSLLYEVPNALVGGKEELLVQLKIRSLQDFEGPALVRAIPALADLEGLGKKIGDASGADQTAADLLSAIRELTAGAGFSSELVAVVDSAMGGAVSTASDGGAPAAGAGTPASEGDSSVDSILDMVGSSDDQAAASADSVRETVGSVLSSMTGGAAKSASKPVERGAAAAQAWIAAKIGAQLDLILHHPDFQSIEAAWRGLKFLVERTDFRQPIVVEALAAQKADLRKVLLDQIVKAEYDIPGDPPLAAILCDVAFDKSNPDIELLNELAVRCEGIQAPLIAQAGAEMFGRKSLQGLGEKGSLPELLSGPAFTKWKSLRAKEECRWIGLTANRMLLRAPWSSESSSVTYPETCDEASGDGLLWGSAVWALGSAMTRSFASEGWAHSIVGARGGGSVEDLPVRDYRGKSGKVEATPLEAVLSDTHVQDLAASGFMVLHGQRGSDTAYFGFLPMITAAKTFSDNMAATQEAAMHSILPYQLFAARMSQWLGRMLGARQGGETAEQLEEGFKKGLAGILGDPDPNTGMPLIRVEVSEDEENQAIFMVLFEIRPDFKFFNLTPRLLLSIPLPK